MTNITTNQKIKPFLWFDGKAEEAARFYCSVFPNSEVTGVHAGGDGSAGPQGAFTVVLFQLEGVQFMALDGGPLFPFTPAVSFAVECATQDEVDAFWDKLSEGGEKGQCGWLQDKYGLSWQIVPSVVGELMSDPDPVKKQRVMAALLQMTKLDIQTLRQAYAQE